MKGFVRNIYLRPPEILISEVYRKKLSEYFRQVDSSYRKMPDRIIETLYPLIGSFYTPSGEPYILPEIDDLFRDSKIFCVYLNDGMPIWRNPDRGRMLSLFIEEEFPDAFDDWPSGGEEEQLHWFFSTYPEFSTDAYKHSIPKRFYVYGETENKPTIH